MTKEMDKNGGESTFFDEDDGNRYDFMSVRKAVKSLKESLGREPTNKEVFNKLSEVTMMEHDEKNARAALKTVLGREPTEDEITDYFNK